MYSAMVIQEVWQRRQEPWGWGADSENDIRSWHQLRAIIEADPLTTTREAAEEINIDHSTVIQHLKQIEKVKKLDKWMPHELTANPKNCRFEVSSFLILCDNNESFLDWFVTWDRKWILHNWRRSAQWSDREAPKHFPKPTLRKKKVMVTVWWSAACLTHYSFLNPRKTIPFEKCAQQKSMRCTKIGNTFSRHRST